MKTAPLIALVCLGLVYAAMYHDDESLDYRDESARRRLDEFF